MKCQFLFFHVCFLLIPSFLNAQQGPPSVHVTHYGVENGLSQGSIYFMHKDSRGFMWFGAYEGLNRFDGHAFSRFYPNENDATTLKGSTILGITEDKYGNLWVGTEMCLNRYDRKKGTFSSVFAPHKDGKNAAQQTHPFYADSAEVWYVNANEGIVRYNFLTQKRQIVDSTLRYKIDYYFNFKAVYKGGKDLWISQPKGLFRLDIQTGKRTAYFSTDAHNKVGESSEIFTYFVDNQTVWLGLKRGLACLDLATNSYKIMSSPVDFSKSIVYNIQVDKEKRVWIGTGDNGVLLFDPLSNRYWKLSELLRQTHRYDNVQIAALYYEPTENVLWINTEPNGLDKLSLDAHRIKNYHNDPQDAHDLNASVVRCFTEDRQGRLWIGVWNGGVNVFDPKTSTFSHHLSDKNNPNSLPNNTVLSICTDAKGRIWAATENGLACYETPDNNIKTLDNNTKMPDNNTKTPDNNTKALDKKAEAPPPDKLGTSPHKSQKTGKWRRYVNNAYPQQQLNANLCSDVFPMSDGTLIVGTAAGLYEMTPKTGNFTPIHAKGDENAFIYNVAYDAQRQWLFYTNFSKGFVARTKRGNYWETVLTGLEGFNATCFYQKTGTDTLWVATNRGFVCFNLNTRQYRVFTVADGMPSNCTYGILPDDEGQLWLSTNRGIARFNPLSKTFKKYDTADGCQGFEYNIRSFYRASRGELYFGGVNGFDRFYPKDLERKTTNFSLYLTDFQVNNALFSLDTVVGEAHKIALKYFENTFSIGFTALDWQNEGGTTYRYRLIEFDKDWVISTNGINEARYVNVPSGNYEFVVEAADRTGVWRQNSARIYLSIIPAWWQTTWFKTLISLICLIGSYFILSFYFNTRYRLRVAALEQEREQERLRTRIAQDIHDEVGSSFTKISLAAQLATRLPNLSDADIKMRFDKLSEDARYGAEHLRDIVFAINPDYDNFSEMQAYFMEFAHNFWQNTTINLVFAFEKNSHNPIVRPDVKRQLLLIFKEAQNNAAKYAHAKTVHLTLKIVRNDRYLMAIKDNGNGFDPLSINTENGHSKGISGMKKRAESIEAQLVIQSKLKEGTMIRVEGKL